MKNRLLEGMSARDKLIKEQLIEYLIDTGYGTYARRLREFDVYVGEMVNGVLIETAAMFPKTGDIAINPGFFELADEEQAWKQLSVIIRHEMLHYLLVHEKRFVDHLVETDPNFEETYGKAETHTIANYAMDWELSDIGYDEYDKEVVRLMTLNGKIIRGLILSDDHPEWVNKPMEELFELVKKEVEEGRIKLPPPPPGRPGHGRGPSPEYADGWNTIMAKFDDPNFSDEELEELIQQISSGQILTI